MIADFNHDGLPDIAYIQGNAIFTNPSNITVALNQQSAPGTFPYPGGGQVGARLGLNVASGDSGCV